MLFKATEILLLSRDSGILTAFISSFKVIKKSAVNTRDINYRDSLRYRNIYINREDPPVELI